MKIFLALVTVGFAATLLFSCNNSIHEFDKGRTLGLDRTQITDLRAIDPNTNKTYAQMLVEEIPEYKIPALDFTLADKYSPDYVLDKTTVRDNSEAFLCSYTSDSMEVMFNVRLQIFDSAEYAQANWVESLYGYNAMEIRPSDADGIIVGDVAICYAEDSINFARGNIHIYLSGTGGNSVVEVAQEIDKQIIKALEDAENRIK